MIAARLAIHPTDDFHQLRDLARLIGLVAAMDRVFHAVGHVILRGFFLHPPERGMHGRWRDERHPHVKRRYCAKPSVLTIGAHFAQIADKPNAPRKAAPHKV